MSIDSDTELWALIKKLRNIKKRHGHMPVAISMLNKDKKNIELFYIDAVRLIGFGDGEKMVVIEHNRKVD